MTSSGEEPLRGEIVAAPVKALVSPEQAAAEWARFEALKQKLLVDDDYQSIAGKRYIKRSGFRKIAVYFGLSDRILEQQRTDRDDRSFTWRIVVEVQAPNGRICAGVGICDSRERSFAHVEHDVYGTAHTRAKSRAISDMVAGGAVSAEEVEAGPSEAQPEAAPSFVTQEGVIGVLEKAGLDTTALTIYPDSGKMMVKPLQYLGDSWRKYDQALAGMGFKWISAAKESHWEVSIGRAAE